MKNLNFSTKSGSQSGSHRVATLASTVGSPSAHRRGTMLKLISVLVLILTIGVGQMWGAVNNGDLFERISAAPVANDEVIIVNSGGTVAMSTTQNSNNRGQASITTSSNQYIYSSSNNVQVLTVSINSSKYSFSTGSGYLQCPSNNNYLRTNSTLDDKTKWTISVSSNVFTILNASQTSRYIAYNSNNSIFSTYASGQSKPHMYKKVMSAPTAVAASSITADGATITITDATNVNNYELYYGTSSTAPTASSTATTTITSGKSKSITGLNSNTTYYVWARAYSSSPARKTGWVALTGNSFKTAAAAPSYTITAQSNNTTYGTVSLSGSVITGSPKANCRYASPAYTVTSGTATVSQSGNEFTVTPSTNCTVTINFEAVPKYTINYHDGSGDDTKTNVYEGTNLITALGTPAASCDATSTTFQGWSTTEIITKTNTAPTYVAANAEVNSTTAAATYYAVYAKVGSEAHVTGGDIPDGVGTTGLTASHSSWYSGNGYKFQGTTYYIQTGDLSSNNYKAVTVKLKAGHNGGSGSVLTIASYDASDKVIDSKTFTPTEAFNSQSTVNTFNLSGSTTIKYVRVSMTSKTNNLGMKYCEVFHTPVADYLTTCCTELGTISGAVTLEQLTSGDNKGKLKATWSMASKTGLADNGIKINIYKVGTAIAVHTSAALSKDATSYTWATAPDKCTEYYATLTTIKANNTYCEGEEQGQSENITTAGYTITYNLTDDHVTKKSGDAPTSSCSGDVGAYYEAVSGYVLPDDITVTNAGTKGTDWLWDSSDGSLIIDASKITGDVAVTITATEAPCDPMSNPSVSVEKTYNGATLSWSAISHAAKYKVYIYNNDDSDLESNENVTGTSYTVSSTLTGLTTYKYRVDAVSENESSYCSSYTTGSFTTPDYPTVKLYYSENGELSAGVDQKILTNFTLPNTAAECNKTFIGWTTLTSYSHASTAPTPFMEKGATWQIPTNEKCTLYAVYADVVQASTSWTRVTAVNTLTGGGTFIMGYEGTAKSGVIVPMRSADCNATTSANGYFNTGTTEESSTSGTINMSSVTETEAYEVYISSPTSGKINIQMGTSSGNYYGATSGGNTSNKARLYTSGNSTETNIVPEFSSEADNQFKLKTEVTGEYKYLKYNTGSPRFAFYNSAGEKVVFYKKNVTEASTTNYATTCMGKVAKPVITGVTGNTTYEANQTVTITSATAGATIKYTTDGSDPASSATTMATGSSFALSTNGTYTIRAIAVKADMMNSDEATAVSNVTIDKPYTTIASFIAAAPTNKKLVLTGAKVLGVTTNYIYIQDATSGIQLNKSSHGITWASGKTLSGYVVGTYSNNSTSAYMPRLTFTDGSTMSVTEDAAALPEATVITAGSEANICKLVKLQNVKFQSTSLSSNTVYVQKSDLDIDTVYNTFGVLNKTLPNSATLCDVTGVLIKYSGKYEIAPVSVDGITTNGAKAILPTLSPAGSTNSGSPTGVEVNEEITVTPAAGMTSTIQEDDETPADLSSATVVTIDADKSITVRASAYYYDDNIATYYYHPDPSLTKYAIGKSAMTNGGVTVKNGDDVVTQAVSGATITLLVAPTTHYHMTGISVKDADQGTVTLTEVTAGEEYTFTMPAKAVTVSATFAEDAYATVAFAKGNESATGSAPSSISKRYVGQTATMPANTFALAAHDFAGWKYGENVYNAGASYTILAEDAAIDGKTITFDAQWTPWPDEATIYSSNISTTNADSKVIPEDEEEYDAWKIAKGSSITLTIPAGTTTIYGHLVAWKDESANVTISGSCFSSNKVLTPAADDGISNNSPFTLEANGSTFYFKLTPDVAIEEDVNITFTTASNKRAVVFGVNAIYPKITLDPEEYEFGNVRANQTKSQEFTITANENVSGTLSASITNDASGKFSVGSISAGKVTVTFDPDGATSGDFTAKLKVEASNASVTADLSGTAIAAEAPEITVDKNAVAFGQVDPNASVSETIAVGLLHIDGAVSAALSGTNANKFSLSTTSLSSDGDLVVAPVTTAIGIYSATLTLSATGADDVVIPLSITVANKWAVKYTSNVEVSASENKKVKVGSDETEFAARKTNSGATATIHLPMGTQKLHLHMVAWKGEGGTVTVSGDCFSSSKSIEVPANDVVSGATGTYTFTDAEALGYYHEIAVENEIGTGGINVSVSKSGSRIVLFGVNQEGGTYEIEDNTNISTLPENANIEVKDGVTLTVDADKTIGDLTVENGGKVTLSNKLTVVGTFSIETTMAGGNSGQLEGATALNFEAGEAYIDITLGAGGTNQQWHAFTVPFPVDVMNGIYDLDGNKLQNEVNYAIMDYHGDIRAQGQYGWKKNRGVLVPGTFYIMATDGYRTTYRFKKTANGALVAGNSKAIYEYASSTGGNDNGWNGIGNPNLFYGKVNLAVQVLDPNSYTFITKTAQSTNFVVGTPFFYQATADGTMVMETANAGGNYAPARERAMEIKDVPVGFGNENFTDYLYVTANEDALNEYETGKDLAKMTMTNTPKVAQIFGKAYNTKLCMVHAPMVNDQAEVALELYAPQAGTYTISVPTEREDASLYLTKDGNIIWDLTMSPYEAEFGKGATEGYGLMLVRKAPQVTTGVETIDNSQFTIHNCQKVILNDHVYILRDGQLYDVTGKAVK